jgi:ketosteroid isomerase-like protein
MLDNLDEVEIEKFIREFYTQADASAPLVWYLPYVEDDFHMVWTPTCQFDGPAGFEEFYRNLTTNLFDRKHEVNDIKIEVSGDTAKVSFQIHLTAHCWSPPLPKAIHAENYANFTWDMRVSSRTGKPVITNYLLTAVKFPEGSIIVDADKVFKYPTFMYGPWGFP